MWTLCWWLWADMTGKYPNGWHQSQEIHQKLAVGIIYHITKIHYYQKDIAYIPYEDKFNTHGCEKHLKDKFHDSLIAAGYILLNVTSRCKLSLAVARAARCFWSDKSKMLCQMEKKHFLVVKSQFTHCSGDRDSVPSHITGPSRTCCMTLDKSLNLFVFSQAAKWGYYYLPSSYVFKVYRVLQIETQNIIGIRWWESGC